MIIAVRSPSCRLFARPRLAVRRLCPVERGNQGAADSPSDSPTTFSAWSTHASFSPTGAA